MEKGVSMKFKDRSKDKIIYVSDIFLAISANIFKIVILSLAFSILTLAYSYYTRDTYYLSEASLEIYSKDYNKESTPFYKLRRFQRLSKEYSQVIKSDEVLFKVKEKINLSKGVNELSRSFDITPNFDDLSLTLTLWDKNSKLSINTVNKIAEVSVEKSKDINTGEGLRIITKAETTEKIVISHLRQTFVIALIFGLMAFTLLTVLISLYIKPNKIKKRVR